MTDPLDDYPMPFSAIAYTRPNNAYMAFPDSHRNGGSLITRVRLPEGISTIQITTSSNKAITLRHHSGGSTVDIGRLPQVTGGAYRTSAPVQVVVADSATEVSLGVAPNQVEGGPVEHVGIIVIPIGVPPAG